MSVHILNSVKDFANEAFDRAENHSRQMKAVGVLLLALTLPGCRQYVAQDVERSSPPAAGATAGSPSSEVVGKSLIARNSAYQPFLDKMISLEGKLVEFINGSNYYYSSDYEYYYFNDETPFTQLQNSIIELQRANQDEISRTKDNTMKILLVDYAEQLGESRGAIFGAWKPGFGDLRGGKIRFSGEGFNELHGCLEKTKALARVIAASD